MTLGAFVSWLARHKPQVTVHILRWDWGAPKLLARGTDAAPPGELGAHPRPNQAQARRRHPAVRERHHQKIVVIDDRLAFCGGST